MFKRLTLKLSGRDFVPCGILEINYRTLPWWVKEKKSSYKQDVERIPTEKEKNGWSCYCFPAQA